MKEEKLEEFPEEIQKFLEELKHQLYQQVDKYVFYIAQMIALDLNMGTPVEEILKELRGCKHGVVLGDVTAE